MMNGRTHGERLTVHHWYGERLLLIQFDPKQFSDCSRTMDQTGLLTYLLLAITNLFFVRDEIVSGGECV